MRKIIPFMTGLPLLLTATSALAYVGPGLGAGTIGVILGFLGSILLAIFALVWFPVKRMLKRRKADKSESSNQATKSKQQTRNPEQQHEDKSQADQ